MNQQPGGMPPVPPQRPTTPPPPPPPEITLRTMQSDMQDLKQSGGAGSAPKPFTPPELKSDLRQSMTPPPMPKMPQGSLGEPRPAMPAGSAAPKIEAEAPKGGNWKKIVLWGGILIVIVAAGVAGYLFVYPALFPQVPPAPPAPVVTPVQTPTPAPSPMPAAPVTAPATTTATSTEATATTTLSATTPAPAPAHVSLLASVANTIPLTISPLDLVTLKAALQTEAQKLGATDTLTEVTLHDANDQMLTAGNVMSAILPDLTAGTVTNLFNADMTTALYKDANGVWPVYILQLSTTASQVAAQPTVTGLESSPNLANLFISAPGAAAATAFKSGTVNGTATRYMPYTTTGASLNIAWSGTKLVISTSYNGVKKVLSDLK